MINLASIQAYQFFVCLCFGFLSALVYEGGYLVRFVFHFNKLVEVVCDCLVIIAIGWLFWCAVALVNFGAIVYYHLAGFILGFFVINLPLRACFRGLGVALLKALKKCKWFVRLYKKITK